MRVHTNNAGAEIDGQLITIAGAETRPPDASFALPLALLPAMLTGEPLEIEGRVSHRLVQAAGTIQKILRTWVPKTRICEIRTKARPTPAASRSVALFFSGGADSMASLIRLKDSVTDLIVVHGFDLPVSDTAGFARCIDRIQASAEVFHKPLRIVKTNLREWSDAWFQNRGFPPWTMYFGAALAGVGLTLHASQVVISSSYSYACLYPWGSHPLLDPALVYGGNRNRTRWDGVEPRRKTCSHQPVSGTAR